MSSDNIDVRYVANLARIDVTDEECVTFQGQLEAILGFIETLKDADVDTIELSEDNMPITDILREDMAIPALEQKDLIRNAPDSALGQIRVPKVVDA